MKTLKFVKPELELPDNIAIIGSSGILKNSNYGKLIDSFDCVVRFNRAPTIGFEEDVGLLTDLYVVNTHVFTNLKISGSGWTEKHYKTQQQYFIKNLKNMGICCIGQDLPAYEEINKYTDVSNEVFYFQYSHMKYLKEVFKFKKNLSVGTCFIALCILSEINVNLFGIDLENRQRDHYWEDRPQEGPCHDIPNEKSVLKKIIKDKKVNIYV